MPRFFATFPQGDRLRRDTYTIVEAPDKATATEMMYAEYGNRWAFVYESPVEAGVERFGLTLIPFGHEP